MFHDLLHFTQLHYTQLACTAPVAYTGDPDYDSLDGNGNVYCDFTQQSATGKLRTAKDGEWADFTGSTTITVRCTCRANWSFVHLVACSLPIDHSQIRLGHV